MRQEDFKKRCTLLGAHDIQGFVVDEREMELLEREDREGDEDKQHSMVDMDRFEQCVEEHLVVPVLGQNEFCEPRLVVVML